LAEWRLAGLVDDTPPREIPTAMMTRKKRTRMLAHHEVKVVQGPSSSKPLSGRLTPLAEQRDELAASQSSVYPSGAELSTACTERKVPAPGRFSITTWPSCSRATAR
jgi:hypothetical protein